MLSESPLNGAYIDNPELYLNGLFLLEDIAGGDMQFDDAEMWERGLLMTAIRIYHGAIQYARNIGDLDTTTMLEKNSNLPEKWKRGENDLMADLNWIYTHLAGEMLPTNGEQRHKITFLSGLYQLGKVSTPPSLTETPKSKDVVIHTKTITSDITTNAPEMTVEELNMALYRAFLDSKEPGISEATRRILATKNIIW